MNRKHILIIVEYSSSLKLSLLHIISNKRKKDCLTQFRKPKNKKQQQEQIKKEDGITMNAYFGSREYKTWNKYILFLWMNIV